jgi:hypothetical protein
MVQELIGMVPNEFQVLAQKFGIRFRRSGNRAEDKAVELRLQHIASDGIVRGKNGMLTSCQSSGIA